MKRRMVFFACLLLAAAMLLQGCTLLPQTKESINQTESTTRPTEPEVSYPEHPSIHEFPRMEDAKLEPTSFQNMEYVRQDTENLCQAYGDVQALVESGADAATVLDAFMPVYDGYRLFSTMASIAYIRHTLDLNDEFYTDENDWNDQQSPLVEQAQEKLFTAIANSEIRGELEELFFEEGFFEFYDKYQVYSNDTVVALMQQEADLQNQFMLLQSDRTISWNGEERLYDEVMEEVQASYVDLLAAYAAYYEKYNPQCVDILVQLIKIRNQIATELGYDSYAEFSYGYTYMRDYTPEQAADYADDIAQSLSPMFYDAINVSYDKEMDMEVVLEKLKDTVYQLGGGLATAYDFMMEYELYDLTESTSKMTGSYETYLSSYEMPFLYVSPEGTIGDLLTVAHEFGHFADGYVNCDATVAVDCAEIFSQGLEYLTLSRADLTNRQREKLTKSKVGDSILTFLSQACYAEFEQRIYELPEKELTAENLNRIFYECNDKYGMGMPGLEDIVGPGWIDINHFFISPFYVISYCVSNDAAFQIFQAENAGEDGLQLYNDLLAASGGNTILALLEGDNLVSPFEEGRMEELADFYAEYFG